MSESSNYSNEESKSDAEFETHSGSLSSVGSTSNSNEEELFDYRLLDYIYHKQLLQEVQYLSTWRSFLCDNPDTELTAEDLKRKFCLKIIPNLDNYNRLNFEKQRYYSGRRFGINADHLLDMCEVDIETFFIFDETAASFNAELEDKPRSTAALRELNAPCVFDFDQENVKPITVSKNNDDCRSIMDLMKIILCTTEEDQLGATLSQEQVDERIISGIRDDMDFTEFWNTRKIELMGGSGAVAVESQQTPSIANDTSQMSILRPSISSTPLISSRVKPAARTSSRVRSLPDMSNTQNSNSSMMRTRSQSRVGESLTKFADRLRRRQFHRI